MNHMDVEGKNIPEETESAGSQERLPRILRQWCRDNRVDGQGVQGMRSEGNGL